MLARTHAGDHEKSFVIVHNRAHHDDQRVVLAHNHVRKDEQNTARADI